MIKILESLFDSNEKQLKKIQLVVDEINSFEEDIKKLSDEQLKDKTDEFRKILNVDIKKARDEFNELNKEELKRRLEDEKKILRDLT